MKNYRAGKLGYHALPLLWRGQVIGWGNVTWKDGQLDCQVGFVQAQPRAASFERELEAELSRTRLFLDR